MSTTYKQSNRGGKTRYTKNNHNNSGASDGEVSSRGARGSRGGYTGRGGSSHGNDGRPRSADGNSGSFLKRGQQNGYESDSSNRGGYRGNGRGRGRGGRGGSSDTEGSSGSGRGRGGRGRGDGPPSRGDRPSQRGGRSEPKSPEGIQERYKRLKEKRHEEREKKVKEGLIHDVDRHHLFKPKLAPRYMTAECEDMCPEFERLERIIQNDVTGPEYDPDLLQQGQKVPREDRMVKKFRRADAGAPAQGPEDIRTPQTLKRTLDYLIDTVISEAGHIEEVANYVWDRTRAIRNDFSILNPQAIDHIRIYIECCERIIRYHLVCMHQCAVPGSEIDNFQEREQMIKAMMTLTDLYEIAGDRYHSPNEAEFRSYQILFYILNPVAGLENELQTRPGWAAVFSERQVQRAIQLYAASQDIAQYHGPFKPLSLQVAAQHCGRRFWNIVKSEETSYVMACAAEIFFPRIRKMILHSIWATYRLGREDATENVSDWTVDALQEALQFDEEEEVIDFCAHFDFEFKVRQDDSGSKTIKYLNLNSVKGKDFPNTRVPKQAHSYRIVERKRFGRTLAAVINGLSVVEARQAGLIDEEDDAYMQEDAAYESSALSQEMPAANGDHHKSLFVTGDSDEEDDSVKEPPANAFNPEAKPFEPANASSNPLSSFQSPFSNPFGTNAVPTSSFGQPSSGTAEATATASNPFGLRKSPAADAKTATPNPFASALANFEAAPKSQFSNPFASQAVPALSTQPPEEEQSTTQPAPASGPSIFKWPQPPPVQESPAPQVPHPTEQYRDSPAVEDTDEEAKKTPAPFFPGLFKPKESPAEELKSKTSPPRDHSAHARSQLLGPTEKSSATTSLFPGLQRTTSPNNSVLPAFDAPQKLPTFQLTPASTSAISPEVARSSAQSTEGPSRPLLRSFQDSQVRDFAYEAAKLKAAQEQVSKPFVPPSVSLSGGFAAQQAPAPNAQTSDTVGQPSSPLPTPKPQIDREKRKDELFAQIAEDLFNEPEKGILQQFIDYHVQIAFAAAQDQLALDGLEKEADSFRRRKLAEKYCAAWYWIVRDIRSKRKGRERRKRHTEAKAAALRKSMEAQDVPVINGKMDSRQPSNSQAMPPPPRPSAEKRKANAGARVEHHTPKKIRKQQPTLPAAVDNHDKASLTRSIIGHSRGPIVNTTVTDHFRRSLHDVRDASVGDRSRKRGRSADSSEEDGLVSHVKDASAKGSKRVNARASNIALRRSYERVGTASPSADEHDSLTEVAADSPDRTLLERVNMLRKSLRGPLLARSNATSPTGTPERRGITAGSRFSPTVLADHTLHSEQAREIAQALQESSEFYKEMRRKGETDNRRHSFSGADVPKGALTERLSTSVNKQQERAAYWARTSRFLPKDQFGKSVLDPNRKTFSLSSYTVNELQKEKEAQRKEWEAEERKRREAEDRERRAKLMTGGNSADDAIEL